MRCPSADNWWKVRANKMPQANSPEEAEEISKMLNKIGFVSQGWHSSFDSQKPNVCVVRVAVLEDALERLMKYEPVDGALFHDHEIVCSKCVQKMRKEAYDGEGKVPEIKCPICKTILVPCNK